jgi:RNA polymerase sigma factor (sigma-70 family)
MSRTADNPLDAAAYGRLVEPLLEQAAGYARCLLRNREDARDAVQQAALRGWERIGAYDPRRPFKGWWFAILRHCCIDLLRRRGVSRTVGLENREFPAPQSVGGGDWESLAMAIERLSLEHQEILRLRYFGDLSYRELAESLGIPEGTVMSRLHLARASLARQIKGQDL